MSERRTKQPLDPRFTSGAQDLTFLLPPISETERRRIEKASKKIRSKRYRSLGDLYFAYCCFIAGGTFAVFSPAVMESTEAAGGGDLKWAFPAFAAIILGYGAKLLYGKK